MSDSARNAMEAVFSNLILFVFLMVASYAVISLVVHKTPAFSKFSHNTKNAIVSVASVFIFGSLGYYFSGASGA